MRRLLLVALVALLWVPFAHADTAPIPDDGSLPWTNPAHQGALEVLAGTIASRIAGRPVAVRCEGENDWAALVGADAGDVLGYVEISSFDDATYAEDAPLAELSPEVCALLQRFAVAVPKPTKCRTLITETVTVWKTVTVKTKVKVKVHGKIVTKVVTRTKRVPTRVDRQTAGPLAPCYAPGGGMREPKPDAYWDEYRSYADAILTLAHESIHLQQARAGVPFQEDPEGEAECYGLQWIARVAEQLGDTPDDGRAIAAYASDEILPGERAEWLADCVPGGALDLSPTDGIWP